MKRKVAVKRKPIKRKVILASGRYDAVAPNKMTLKRQLRKADSVPGVIIHNPRIKVK